jgi:hypothetical protein
MGPIYSVSDCIMGYTKMVCSVRYLLEGSILETLYGFLNPLLVCANNFLLP